MSAKATIQADVGPGDQTGIYYITICNLPFGTTWQRLKDWTRPKCHVDHIEIFGTSTSGWVRVKGKQNFEKAWAAINGGHFDGRVIIASDKNRTQSIKIKELVEVLPPPSPSQASPSQASPSQTPVSLPPAPTPYTSPILPVVSSQYPATYDGQYYMAGSPQVTISGYSIPSPAGSISTPMTPTTYAATSPRDYYSEMDPHALPYTPHHGYHGYHGSQYSLPYRSHFSGYGTSPIDLAQPTGFAATNPTENPSEYLPLEPHKIHMKTFPQQARVEHVKAWIQRKSGNYSSKITNIEVPKNNNSRYLLGHALAVFNSASAARGALGLLNKSRYLEYRITARLAVDGDYLTEPSPAPSASASTSIPASPIPTGPKAVENKKYSKNKDSRVSSYGVFNRAYKPKPSDHRHLARYQKKASGSDGKGKSSSDKNKTDKKKEGKDAGPVIADGSSQKSDN